MFDDFERRDDVERVRSERKRCRGRFEELRFWEMRGRVFNRFARNVDSDRQSCTFGQIGRSVSRAAAQVEHALAASETFGECITGHMLSPQVVVYFAGNNSLSRKLVHDAMAPMPSF